MEAQSNKDYYNILLEACKEAFEVLEQKDFLYTNEAMIENNEITFSPESIELFGSEKSNDMIVQYRLREAMEYSFLTYLERQYLLLKRDMLFERKDFYRKCLTALNIEFTKFLKEGGRVPPGYNCVKNPDVLLFLERMKTHLKGRAEVPDKISQISANISYTKNEPQQNETVKNPDEVKKSKDFKDFFNSNVSDEVIEKIKEEFKDYYGKNMAYLIYLLNIEFKLITYYLESKTDSRKHFVYSLNKSNPKMQGINECFNYRDYTLENSNWLTHKNLLTIKDKLQQIQSNK
jgi:hypothetical protein